MFSSAQYLAMQKKKKKKCALFLAGAASKNHDIGAESNTAPLSQHLHPYWALGVGGRLLFAVRVTYSKSVGQVGAFTWVDSSRGYSARRLSGPLFCNICVGARHIANL